MKVLVTGSNGFIGQNLSQALNETPGLEIRTFVRGQDADALRLALEGADAVVHLAGENRPANEEAFAQVNTCLTETLCNALADSGNKARVILASSAQAELDNPYGRSKQAAERLVEQLARANGNPVAIYRLPGVFGKWCRPNYNSVVATFCHNIANDLPIQVNNPAIILRLVHIDDVVGAMVAALQGLAPGIHRPIIAPEYNLSLGELAAQIKAFRDSRKSLISERVGTGLGRALYATYVSYLPPREFAYALLAHADERGTFVEILKTQDSGQVSFFTAHPGVTRGGHYHHAKTEKFLVLKGSARFRFRQIRTNETFSLETSGEKPEVVETVPGWAHDITNIGTGEMIVMLWANEIFDRNRPDTFAYGL